MLLLKGLTIEVVDEEDEKSVTYHYENGLTDFVEYINFTIDELPIFNGMIQ